MTVTVGTVGNKYKALRIQVWPKNGIIVGPRDVLTINPTLGIRLDSRSVTNENQTKTSIKGIFHTSQRMDPHGLIP